MGWEFRPSWSLQILGNWKPLENGMNVWNVWFLGRWWNKCFWGDSWVSTRPKVFAEETYKELCERISRNCKLPYLNKTTTNLGERLQVRLQTSSRKVCIHECGYPASMYWECCKASEMRLWPADEPPIRLLCRSFIQIRWVCTMRRARAIRDPALPRGVLQSSSPSRSPVPISREPIHDLGKPAPLL